MNKRIYLAGPEVFFPNAKEMGEDKKAICVKYGFEGVFPLDQDIKLEYGDVCSSYSVSSIRVHPLARKIREANEQAIRSCGLVIANATPFRGVSAGVGTGYEIGFARALGLPVFLYSNVIDEYLVRVIEENGGVWLEDSYGRKCVDDEDMHSIEDFGLPDNLMLFAIDTNKDFVACVDRPDDRRWNSLFAFERCVDEAKRRYGSC